MFSKVTALTFDQVSASLFLALGVLDIFLLTLFLIIDTPPVVVGWLSYGSLGSDGRGYWDHSQASTIHNPIDPAWYLGERIASWYLGPITHCIPHPPPLDMFWGRDMVGPTLEGALAETEH